MRKRIEDACCKLCQWTYDEEAEMCMPRALIVNGVPRYSPRACVGDYEDAVEFEARVVEKLSRYVNMEPWPNLWPECISCKDHRKYDDEACPPCVLKHTRIEVEEEMENG